MPDHAVALAQWFVRREMVAHDIVYLLVPVRGHYGQSARLRLEPSLDTVERLK